MKLTQFATAALIVLLVVAGYLTIKSDQDARQDVQNTFNKELLARMEDLSKKQVAPVPSPPAAPIIPAASIPNVPATGAEAKAGLGSPGKAASIPAENAPMAPADDPRMNALEAPGISENEREVLNLGANNRVANESLDLPASLDGQALNAVQSRIVAIPAIGQVKEYTEKDGFNIIVLNCGKNRGLKPGDAFALRRRSAIVGRVTISDTLDDTQSVADLVAGSMQPGMTPQRGDDIVQWDQQR